MPNIIDDDVPLGADEDENVELKKVLEPPRFDFKPLEHWQLAEKNGWIDFAAGAKLSGSRFSVLRGQGAKLARALVNYMIDFNSSRGFELVNVPFLVSSNTLFGTGQLPKFADDLYKIDDEDLYLIPTSEVPVTNLYNDEIITENELPIKMTCYSACFRKEAGSAGKDTRGMVLISSSLREIPLLRQKSTLQTYINRQTKRTDSLSTSWSLTIFFQKATSAQKKTS